MAIFAVPLGMPVKKPFVTTVKARGSAAFSHEAEDLVVFSPRLYKGFFFNRIQRAGYRTVQAPSLKQLP
jgi:hypothetical protein